MVAKNELGINIGLNKEFEKIIDQIEECEDKVNKNNIKISLMIGIKAFQTNNKEIKNLSEFDNLNNSRVCYKINNIMCAANYCYQNEVR
ncbi:42593_t:CDS:2 [Gigaspora margarita]|uniref:42593_t:CDS:1 n=1 Tax=Gigaspora margarita TaxID=4874 RepID=A0ABM8W472_GIGMA|nr:42593_t:CDS:2 [Gigaspora margarita]